SCDAPGGRVSRYAAGGDADRAPPPSNRGRRGDSLVAASSLRALTCAVGLIFGTIAGGGAPSIPGAARGCGGPWGSPFAEESVKGSPRSRVTGQGYHPPLVRPYRL